MSNLTNSRVYNSTINKCELGGERWLQHHPIVEASLSKPVILTLARYYLPGFRAGGPIRSISNLVANLGDEFDFRIVTLSRDAFEAEPYPEVRDKEWVEVGKAKVFYIGEKSATKFIPRIVSETPHDLLYLNSIFDPIFSIAPLLTRKFQRNFHQAPALIAPRGEFSSGALAIKSWRKAAYIAATKFLEVHRDVVWQASTPHEAIDIRRRTGCAPERVVVAPDLSQRATGRGRKIHRKEGDPLRVCFLSRISPMKNLDYALRILKSVKAPVIFSIYGLDEGGEYSRHCRGLAAGLPSNLKVSFNPPVPHEEIGRIFAEHDLLFVPSRGENYGHVFIEALSVGLPILTSDKTPWLDLENIGVGWSLNLDAPGRFVEALEVASNWSREASVATSERCVEFAAIHLKDAATIEANRELFTIALRGKGS